MPWPLERFGEKLVQTSAERLAAMEKSRVRKESMIVAVGGIGIVGPI